MWKKEIQLQCTLKVTTIVKLATAKLGYICYSKTSTSIIKQKTVSISINTDTPTCNSLYTKSVSHYLNVTKNVYGNLNERALSNLYLYLNGGIA